MPEVAPVTTAIPSPGAGMPTGRPRPSVELSAPMYPTEIQPKPWLRRPARALSVLVGVDAAHQRAQPASPDRTTDRLPGQRRAGRVSAWPAVHAATGMRGRTGQIQPIDRCF